MSFRCKCCGNYSNDRVCKKCFKPYENDGNKVSFAFSEQISDFSDFSQLSVTVLDFYKSTLENLDVSKFTQLKKLRVSHCENLVSLKVCSSLKVLDASFCKKLNSIDFEDAKNIECIDLSYDQALNSINGDFSNCKAFICPQSSINAIPNLPSALYIDVSHSPLLDLNFLKTAKKCQYLNITGTFVKNIYMEDYPELTNLLVLLCFGEKIIFKKDSQNLKLVFVFCNEVENKPEIQCKFKIQGEEYTDCTPLWVGNWQSSLREFFGPWPSPECDREEIHAEKPFSCVPEGTDNRKASDAIAGAIFGCALADSFSMRVDKSDKLFVNAFSFSPIDVSVSSPYVTGRDFYFYRGTFSDETSMMLIFIRSIVDMNGTFDITDIAKKLKDWVTNGFKEHRDSGGFGYGPTTANAVRSELYVEHPIRESFNVWKKNGMFSAGNAAIMRTAAVGCYKFWSESEVIENAKQFALITHPHPYCVYGSILVSLLIARFIKLRAGLCDSVNIDETIEECLQYVEMSDKEEEALMYYCHIRDMDDINLSDTKVAPTLLTLACAVWSLRKNLSFEQCVEEILRRGGDVNPNCSIVGACVGAKYGYSSLPKDFIMFFWYRFAVKKYLVPFLELMGLEFDPNTVFHYQLGEDSTLLLRKMNPPETK